MLPLHLQYYLKFMQFTIFFTKTFCNIIYLVVILDNKLSSNFYLSHTNIQIKQHIQYFTSVHLFGIDYTNFEYLQMAKYFMYNRDFALAITKHLFYFLETTTVCMDCYLAKIQIVEAYSTLHKAAKRISKLLRRYNDPYCFQLRVFDLPYKKPTHVIMLPPSCFTVSRKYFSSNFCFHDILYIIFHLF